MSKYRGWLSNGVIVRDLLEVSSNYGIILFDGTDFDPLLVLDRWREVATIIAEHHGISPSDLIDAIETAERISQHHLLQNATCGTGWPGKIKGPITFYEFETLRLASEAREGGRAPKQVYLAIRRREFDSQRARLSLQMIEAGILHRCAVADCEAVTDLTIDHKIPLSRGGSDELNNLQFMCWSHNSSKGDRLSS